MNILFELIGSIVLILLLLWFLYMLYNRGMLPAC